MNNSDTYKHYLRDLIYLLKEKHHSQPETNDFDNGSKLELQSVIQTIENQAESFGLDLDEIGFYDFEKYMGWHRQ